MRYFRTPAGYDLLGWIRSLTEKVRDPNIVVRIIDDRGKAAQSCDESVLCLSRLGRMRGLINHLRWPDGVADRGGHDWERDMLNFLAAHARPR